MRKIPPPFIIPEYLFLLLFRMYYSSRSALKNVARDSFAPQNPEHLKRCREYEEQKRLKLETQTVKCELDDGVEFFIENIESTSSDRPSDNAKNMPQMESRHGTDFNDGWYQSGCPKLRIFGFLVL